MYIFACTYVCALCVCLVSAESKRGYPLELELWMIVSHQVGARK